ncbi:MAG TPA: two-component regulator propeller domain-containing protein [Candidatus Polarisedimenticolia bacterium]|nr:two-component regulator propeller domain-containing protein [Candidatus Polarisedimenticolia bacterium]
MISIRHCGIKRLLLRSAGLVLLGCLYSTHLSLASQPKQSFPQYVVTTWSGSEGPEGRNTIIAQTRDGYLWTIMEGSLVRFDGVRFTAFNSDNTPEIRTKFISSLFLDHRGDLWIATDNGLVRFSNGHFFRYTTADGLSDNTVWQVTEGTDGDIWIGTAKGLVRFRDGHFKVYERNKDLSNTNIDNVYGARDGSIWISNGRGVSRFNGEKFILQTDEFLAKTTNSLAIMNQDNEGRLWIATYQWLARYQGGKFVIYGRKQGLPDDSISAIGSDHSGTIWIGTRRSGLYRLRDGVIAPYGAQNEFGRWINAIYEDRDHNLWIVSTHGLTRLSEARVDTYGTGDGEQNHNVVTVTEDRNHDIWLASTDVSRIHEGKSFIYTKADGLAVDQANIVYADSRGAVWIGWHTLLARYQNDRITNMTLPGNLLALYEDRKGNLWAGTCKGLSQFVDGKLVSSFTGPFSDPCVRAIAEDKDGSLWLGTGGGGIFHWDGHASIQYSTPQGLASPLVLALHMDREGALWIGTHGGGLSRFQDGRIQNFCPIDGLRDGVIPVILEDDAGNLWINAEKEILRVSKKELNDCAAGRIRSVPSVSYDTADGMKGTIYLMGIQPQGWKAEDGSLWFATGNGVVRLDPRKLNAPRPPASVLIEEPVVDGKLWPLAANLELAPGSHRLELHYTALDLSSPQKLSFKYILEGFDTDWTDGGQQRAAYYANLSPGHYRFRVAARNRDGVWSETASPLELHVQPHYYQTLWFYFLEGSLVLGLGFVAYWLHLRQVTARLDSQFQERLSERTRIAQDLHDTLLQGFLSASMQLHVANDQLPADSPAKALVSRVLELMRHVIEEGRNALRGLHSAGRDTDDLELAFSRIRQELGLPQQVGFRIIVGGASRPLRPAVRDEVYLIGREALINAFSHSSARNIEVELGYEPSHFRALIRDDGCGIDPQVLRLGRDGHWGLSGMRERAERIGGKLRVLTSALAGTEVELVVPSRVAFESQSSDGAAKWFSRLYPGKRKKDESQAGSKRNQ